MHRPLLHLCLALASALPLQAEGHGIKPREQQFPAGVPVTPDAHMREVSLAVDADGWPGDTLTVAYQEEVLFVLHNRDSQAHMFVIGNTAGQRDQALMHRLMPSDRYEYPNTRHLAAGESATLGWRFNRAGSFTVQCLLPDHQAHEHGTRIRVLPAP